jgi:diguanylate cyclase (GGDEF)-like protein
MRRNIPYLRAEEAVLAGRFRTPGTTQIVGSRLPTSRDASAYRSSKLRQWKPDLENTTDEVLSSTLLTQDKELAGILEEVAKISTALESEAPDTRTLRDALKHTVLCAIRQSLLDRELRVLALTDDLTHISNRRAFLALAGQQLKVTRRKAEGLLLFFADVDNLKEINDLYGHREGDLALIRAANALEQTFRHSDVIARVGGDEFAASALEASCENREVILRRLERNLKKLNAGETRYELSLSVGMSRFDPKHPVSLGKLLAAAHEAMYEAKRNRSRMYAASR